METTLERPRAREAKPMDSPPTRGGRGGRGVPRVITYAEAEELLRVSRSTLQRLIRAEEITALNVTGRTRRILLASVEAYLRRRLP